MSALLTKVVLYSPLAFLYGAVGMVFARLCVSRLELVPRTKRWLFCVLSIGIFSPVVILTSSVGEFVVPLAGAFIGVFVWHPINFVLVLLYGLVCLYFANRWFDAAPQAASPIPWSWSVFLRWFISTVVFVPIISALSLIVPPVGFLVAMLWIALTPGGALLMLLAVALIVSSIAAVLKAEDGSPNTRVQATPASGAPDPER